MTESESAARPRQSSIVRVAAYVASVGEGNKFKKLAMLDAVPEVSQADRRMRDLRPMGWVIDNYKVNPSLSPDEYLLRKIGTRIDQGEKAQLGRKTISGPRRRRILDRDGNACQVCGTRAGEPFDDDPTMFARLSIGHIIPVARGGSNEDDNLRAECQRDNDESRDISSDPPTSTEVFAHAQAVGGLKEKTILFQWMQSGKRARDEKERVFNEWSRLPYEQRLEVMGNLAAQVIKQSDA